MSNEEELRARALEYHILPRPGKVEIAATKPLANQNDLAPSVLAGGRRTVRGDRGRSGHRILIHRPR